MILRGMSFDSHRALEAGLGIVLLVLPFLLAVPGDAADFSTAAIVVAGVIGLLLATIGFAGRRAGEAVPVSTHAQLDRLMIATMLAAALVFAIAGEGEAVLLLAIASLLQTVLMLSTRYTPG
jgi:hypothetical protein